MTLTNFYILDVCKKYNIPLNGVFSKDELPLKKNRKQGGYVINLQDDDGNDRWMYIGQSRCSK